MLRVVFGFALVALAQDSLFGSERLGVGISYTNIHVPKAPWSIHVVQVPRSNAFYEIHSLHANSNALGLSKLSQQIATANAQLGIPVAGLNGDFYQRDKSYAGDPRGLQIIEGEIISAPSGGASFWIDGFGEPHATNVFSLFQVTWPDGTSSRCGLNEERKTNSVVLFTPTLGRSTHTAGGREFVLHPAPGSPWLPLRIPRTYTAQICQVHESGDAPLEAGSMVLSVDSALLAGLPPLAPGTNLILSTGSAPGLRGTRCAVSGGPILIANGKKQVLPASSLANYEVTSMLERHPRSAVGWNNDFFFLVEVDGRQPNLSVGMTLEELTSLLVDLGCREAMNLDGGGSATLWFAGKVQNSPCDGHERDIANSLVVMEKAPTSATQNALLRK